LFATRATVHSGLQATPGSLAFARDMILDIPVVADWLLIQEHRQQLIDQRLITDNRGRFSHDYHVGDEVLKLQYKPGKLDARTKGPYRVLSFHTNGTVTIRLDPYTLEHISIRRIKAFKRYMPFLVHCGSCFISFGQTRFSSYSIRFFPRTFLPFVLPRGRM
jgi:hypothetical protein